MTTTAVSAAPSFAESTLAALLRGLTKQIAAQRDAEEDIGRIQDQITETRELLAEQLAALEGAREFRRGAKIVREKLEREARAQGADDDDIFQAARESWHLDQI